MKIKKYIILIVMAFLAGITVSCSPSSSEKPIEFVNPSQIGVWGPIRLSLPEEWVEEQNEIQITIEPHIDFVQKWSDTELMIRFEKPMNAGQSYLLTLHRVEVESNQILTEQSWEFVPRAVELVYLVPSDGGGEIWRTNPADGKSRQLSFTNSTVLDFNTALDGNELIFSVSNDEKGSDIWTVDRDGEEMHLFAACGTNRCISPSYSHDGTRVAYIEIGTGEGGQVFGKASIKIFDYQTNETRVVLESEDSPVLKELSWSPDSEYLGFFDVTDMHIRILNVNSGLEIDVGCESSEMGHWSKVEDKLFLVCLEITPGDTCKVINEMDLSTGQMTVSPVYEVLGRKDYSTPALTDDGEWMVFGERCIEERPTKQLWFIDMRTLEGKQITDNVRYNYSNYRWDPAGDHLVIQQFELGSSSASPEILIWQRETNKLDVLVENAHSPVWLP